MSSDITIKTYKDHYTDAQFSLGQRLSSHWSHYFQIRGDRLKEIYSDENFDPTTRFYAFIGERLVGFVSAAFEPASENYKKNELMTMQFPFADLVF